MTNQERFIATDDLEQMARALFNGGMAPLPKDPLKRRNALAAEFSRAHVEIPNVSKRDVEKFAALGAPFKAIADSRQARVNEWLAALPQPLTHAAIREKLVRVLGERALGVRLLHARHAVAACLVLIDALEGRNTPLDLSASDADKLVARLDAAFGKPARVSLLPRGPHYIGDAAKLCAELADAVLAERASATPPAHPASAPKSSIKSAEQLAAAIRGESDPIKRAHLFSQFKNIN